MKIELGLSYDDVLLVPMRSPVRSRKDVSTKTLLTKDIELNIPIVSSNMDTVTEGEMAIALAQMGGIGIIHRFNTIEQQVEEVKKVKRFRHAIIERPITISPEKTLESALELMEDNHVTSVLVVKKDELVGIMTHRDYRFDPPISTKVKDLMTPKDKLVVAMNLTDLSKAKKIMMKHKIEKLPIINEDWSVKGLVTAKDIHNIRKYPDATLDNKNRLRVGAAIGVKDDAIDRAKALVEAGCDVLVIDIAHGHSDLEIDILKEIKKVLPDVPVIAGNVATAKGAEDLIKAGADCIKVGVGPGSICTTRIVTGSGYPQLSAVMNAASVAKKYGVPIIADGGIKQPGDITKAIAAGAQTVMLGSMLAGTDESPGEPIIKNGRRVKIIRGMASYGAKLGRDSKENKQGDVSGYVPEGVEAVVPYKGGVIDIIYQLVGGFRSGMSYGGAKTIPELQKNAEFVRITGAGLRESHAHDVNVM